MVSRIIMMSKQIVHLFSSMLKREIFSQYLIPLSDLCWKHLSWWFVQVITSISRNLIVKYPSLVSKERQPKVWITNVRLLKSCINSFHCSKLSFWFGPFSFSVTQRPSVEHEQQQQKPVNYKVLRCWYGNVLFLSIYSKGRKCMYI